MKIVFLSFYSGKIDRGVEVATEALAQGLGEHHEVKVFQAGERITPGIPAVHIPVESQWPTDTGGGWWRRFYLDYYSIKILLFTLKCIPFIIKAKPDVLIPTNGGWQIVLSKLFCLLFKVKLVVQGNAGIGRDDHWLLLLRPHFYIAISPAGFDWAHKIAPKQPMRYIPLGVDIFAIQQSKEMKIPLPKPIVLCVSALVAYKRVELLIKAFAKVKDASLLVIGQGPLESDIELLGKKLLGERFLLKTNVKHADLYGYYKAAALFSLPSAVSEAFGIVYVEAMAAGLPVVATNDYNRQKIIGEAGFLVDPTDTEKYAQTLQKALLTDFKKKPQLQAEQFSWKKIITQYNDLLGSL